MRDFQEAPDVGELMWDNLCKSKNMHRYHPDMTKVFASLEGEALTNAQKAATQVAYLNKDSEKKLSKEASSVEATCSQQGSVSEMGGKLQVVTGPKVAPKPIEDKKGDPPIEDSSKGGGSTPKSRPKKLSKEELKAAQEEEQRKEQEKKEKASKPLERGKTLLRKCPVAIRELSVATQELKLPAIKKCMPQRFHGEYAHALGSHMETLNEIRQALEGAMSKDEKLFTKRIGDQLDVGEKSSSRQR